MSGVTDPASTNEGRYEYVVTYKNPTTLVFGARRGRQIKQTSEGADSLISWARARGYKVTTRRRTVGEWEDSP